MGMSELRAAAKHRTKLAEAERLAEFHKKVSSTVPDEPMWVSALDKERVYLIVHFNKKDIAKRAGALWDDAEKHWYITRSMQLDSDSLQTLSQFASFKKVAFNFQKEWSDTKKSHK